MLRLGLKSLRTSWPAYAGALAALTLGITLISLAVTLIGAVEATLARADIGPAERTQLDGLSSLFGIMSAVSLFMALFVVGSTFGFAVATRQRELGLLRLIGATPRQVRRLLLGEAAVVGLVASSVACLLVTALAPAGLWAVHAMGVTSLKLSAPSPWLAWTIATSCGLGVALAGCWRSSRRAAKVPPSAALREASIERRTPGFAGWCVGLLALVTAGLAGLSARDLNPLAALVVAVCLPAVVVIGLQALGPVVVPRVAGFVARPFVRRSVAARLARDEVRASARTTSSVAAPVVAISAIAGSLVLTLSLSVDWTVGLSRAQLAAPVVVADSEAAAQLRAHPVVDLVDARRTASVSRAGVEEVVDVVDVAASTAARGLRALDGNLEELRGRSVAVTRSWLWDSEARLGDRLEVRADGAPLTLRIVAVVPDAPELHSDILVPNGLPLGDVETHELFVTPGAGVTEGRLLEAVRSIDGSAMTADTWLDQVAASTRHANDVALVVLLGPAGIYAGIAIVNVTLIGAAHRARSRRLLALVGATPAQVRQTVLWQAMSTTIAGLVLGAATTAFVGWLVAQAVERDLADQSVELTIPWLTLGGVAAVCVALAILAAATAIWLADRQPRAAATRSSQSVTSAPVRSG